MAHIQALIKQNKRGRGSALRNTCRDRYSSCPRWASAGYCQRTFVTWMTRNCPKSCNKCPCKDQFRGCDDWAARGYCSNPRISSFMRRYCPAACSICYSCKCGQANKNNRIVGGDPTDKNKYPWQVLLVQNSRLFCGGSIISKKEILTAAHCTQGRTPTNIYVLVGDHDKSQLDGEKAYRVCSKKEHESYNNKTVDYDFSILTLCKEIDFSKKVSPACLPDSAGQDPGLNEGVETIVSGWGRLSDNGSFPNVLQEITMKTMANRVCTTKIVGYYRVPLTDRMLCGEAGGKSVCRGDSGGPWTTKVGSNYIQTGVSSWAPKDRTLAHCIPGVPSVAARVSNQLNWIKKNMKHATCPRA